MCLWEQETPVFTSFPKDPTSRSQPQSTQTAEASPPRPKPLIGRSTLPPALPKGSQGSSEEVIFVKGGIIDLIFEKDLRDQVIQFLQFKVKELKSWGSVTF